MAIIYTKTDQGLTVTTGTEMEQYPSYGEGLFSIYSEITQNL